MARRSKLPLPANHHLLSSNHVVHEVRVRIVTVGDERELETSLNAIEWLLQHVSEKQWEALHKAGVRGFGISGTHQITHLTNGECAQKFAPGALDEYRKLTAEAAPAPTESEGR